MSLTLLEAAQAKMEGVTVEYSYDNDLWKTWKGEDFNPNSFIYRIAPEPKRKDKTLVLAWFDGVTLIYVEEYQTMPKEWKRVPSEDKEIEVEND